MIDVARTIFPDAPFVPLVVGAPTLGRYCVFGNLFATSGVDPQPYRLDRHPSMSRHPVTPADESTVKKSQLKWNARHARSGATKTPTMNVTSPTTSRMSSVV